jgi:hypothetical protein
MHIPRLLLKGAKFTITKRLVFSETSGTLLHSNNTVKVYKYIRHCNMKLTTIVILDTTRKVQKKYALPLLHFTRATSI